MSKDSEVPISAGTCAKMRVSCRTMLLGVIGTLVIITVAAMSGLFGVIRTTQAALADVRAGAAGTAATVDSIKEDTTDIKRKFELMERREHWRSADERN